MRRLLLLLLLVPLACFGQKIYKHVDADGNVTYSDEPMGETAEEVELPPISFVDTRVPEGQAFVDQDDAEAEEDPEADEVIDYGELRVVSPEAESTHFAAQGPVPVSLQAGQPLAAGHSFQVFLDGRPVAVTPNPSLLLENVVRGAHEVRAQIVDQTGQVFASSEPITFYYRQPSVLLPGRSGGPNAARPANRSGN